MIMKKNNAFILKILLSSLARRRSRMAVALTGIAIGATVLLGMVTLCYDIPRQMSREFRSYGANLILVAPGQDSALRLEDIARGAALLPQDRLLGLTPYRYQPVRNNMLPYTAVGANFAQVQKTSPYWRVTGAWPVKKNEILIGADIAEMTKLAPGRTITLDGRNKEQARFEQEMVITGIVKTGGVEDGFIFMDLGDMENMTGEAGWADVAEISITAGGQELEQLAASIRGAQVGIEARLVKKVTQSEQTVLGKLKTLVYLVTVVVLGLTMICVATTMMTVVMERRREIGLKKALGAENRAIASEFLAEGLILGIFGGLIGACGGLIFAQAISASVFDRSIAIEVHLIPVTVLVSALVTILACLIPVRRAVDVEPALVLRGE